jgi:hypothetical protein
MVSLTLSPASGRMTVEVPMDDKNVNELLKCTKALLLVQLRAVNNDEDPIKPEVVMARAGFATREIAELLGKTSAAVAKAVQRAGKQAA